MPGTKLALIISFLTFPLFALPPSQSKFWSFDLGVYKTNLKEALSVPNEFRSAVSTTTGMLRIRHAFVLGKKVTFEPSVSTLLPWSNGVDGSVRIFQSYLDLPLSYSFSYYFRFRTGPSIQWTFVMPKGQEVQLNNGTQTSPFYLPGNVQNAVAISYLVGFDVHLSHRFCFGLDTYISDLLSSVRRRYNGLFYVGIKI